MRAIMLALCVLGIGAADAGADDMTVPASGLKWGDAPPILPKGAQAAVVMGDPTKSGPFVIRLKTPANYKIPAHHHPTAEYVTVLSGNFHMGMGDKFDPAKGRELKAGDFAAIMPNMNHFAWATSESVVQVHGEGPFAFIYVDPADDPTRGH